MSIAPGTPVWLWSCDHQDIQPANPMDPVYTLPVDPQRWTYNPEAGTLQNALGNVLDVQGGVLQPGTPVWTWTRNGDLAQLWY